MIDRFGYESGMKCVYPIVLLVMMSVAGLLVAGEKEVHEKEVIAQIRKWYNVIQSDKTLKKQEVQAVSELPYEPKLVRYTDKDGALKKLEIELQSDHGFTHESYYFEKGELFFIYAVDEYWQFAPDSDPEKPTTIDVGSQQRYYFEGDQCIRALEKQVETSNGEKLRELLAKAENKPLEVGLGAAEYVRKAKLVSKIKTVSDLERFISTYTK